MVERAGRIDLGVAASDVERRGWAIGASTLSAGLVISEAALILLVAIATGVGYHLVAYGDAGDIANYVTVGSLLALLFVLPTLSGGQHRARSFIDGKRNHGRTFVAWNVAFLCLAFIGLMTKTTGIFSRAWLVAFYATGLLSLMALEGITARVVASASARGRIASRRLMVIGAADDLAWRAETASADAAGIRVVARVFLQDAGDDEDVSAVLSAAVESARRLDVDDIVVESDWRDEEAIRRIVAAFAPLPVGVHLGVSDLLSRVSDARITTFGRARVLSLTAPPLSAPEAALKRGFDIVVSATALLLLSPLFAVIAVLTLRDSGAPVFFRQRRRGYNLQEFRIWKFRTMTAQDDGDVVRQARSGDARITRVGAFLRRWNLDELPQLINVLSGDMSLVGPRPHAVAHDRFYETRIDQYQRRLNVRPGITGWAQVNGHRGPTENDEAMRARVEHDLYYIDNWSIWFDIYIMVATVIGPKAYRNAI